MKCNGEGWEYPYVKIDGTTCIGTPKAHYFKNGVSLCGKYRDEAISSFEDHNELWEGSSSCLICQSLREALKDEMS